MEHKSFRSFSAQVAALEAGLAASKHSGFLGADFCAEDSKIILLPVPWEATVSYRQGTSKAPSAIVTASHQLDIMDPAFGKPYRAGIAFLPIDENVSARNKLLCNMRDTDTKKRSSSKFVEQVNDASHQVNDLVQEIASLWLGAGKVVCVVGGDHSSPFGLIQALGNLPRHKSFGILHFDAHLDYRQDYEGFTFSHASIMHNVTQHIPAVTKLVHVGIRDYSQDEESYARHLGDRAKIFFDRDIYARIANGEPFAAIAKDIVNSLPQEVYISFDIDGLDPSFCPSTGTPVPGGLTYNQAAFILEQLVDSGRQIIGFDLCEVAPSHDGQEWDENVGARILYKLCGAAVKSQKLIKEN